jgi:hypothetical protein
MDRIGCLEDKIRPLKFYFEHRVQRREGRIYMFDLLGDVPLSMEEPGSFSGIFEIDAADNAKVVGWKRRPICAENVDCRPSRALRHPWRPDLPLPFPYLPKWAKGAGVPATCRSTDHPTIQWECVMTKSTMASCAYLMFGMTILMLSVRQPPVGNLFTLSTTLGPPIFLRHTYLPNGAKAQGREGAGH